MKNYRSKLIVLALGLVFFGCADRLEIAPPSNVSVDVFYQTSDDIEQAVVAAYDALQNEGQYGFNFMMYMEIRSDNASVESPTNVDGEYGDIDLFQLSSGNTRLASSWNSCYEGIQRCNIVLNRIGNVDMDESAKTIRSGEVKFIRALTYFNLVRMWGDVPLVTTETTDPFDAFAIGRSSIADVYDQIITDLDEAVAVLPATSDAGRATSGAAKTLLGKVHLTLENWDEAVSTLSGITGYTLNANFGDNFGIANKNSPESIFEVQFQSGVSEGSPYPNQVAPVGSADSLLNGIGSQRGENIPSSLLYNSFETGDLRRDLSIGIFNGTINFAVKLIDIPLADYDSDLNVIVFRYADVLLMRAEALNEQGYAADGEAFDLLNQIRNRAGLADLTSVELPNQDSFREAVTEERRHEFVSENHRWFDLIRTGKAMEVMNASTSAFSVLAHQLLFPIPLSALDAINNPEIFDQNDGY